jgi:hypothetical protein
VVGSVLPQCPEGPLFFTHFGFDLLVKAPRQIFISACDGFSRGASQLRNPNQAPLHFVDQFLLLGAWSRSGILALYRHLLGHGERLAQCEVETFGGRAAFARSGGDRYFMDTPSGVQSTFTALPGERTFAILEANTDNSYPSPDLRAHSP